MKELKALEILKEMAFKSDNGALLDYRGKPTAHIKEAITEVEALQDISTKYMELSDKYNDLADKYVALQLELSAVRSNYEKLSIWHNEQRTLNDNT